jgi:hypothetical protein
MQESHGEGVAIHTGPESCAYARKGGREALTGERAGRAFSRERAILRDADAFGAGGRPHRARRHRKTRWSPARSQTPSTSGYISIGTREGPCPPAAEDAAGRVGTSMDARR